MRCERNVNMKRLKQNSVIDLNKEDDFESVFKSYYAPLCYYAKNIAGDYYSEDLVSSVFIKLYESKKEFSSIERFLVYIYACVKNACFDHLKVHKRTLKREEEFSRELEEYNTLEKSEIIQNELLAETYRELKGLPLQCQKVITLGYIEGKKNDEIAQQLGLSVQTVKNHKYRAVRLLKDRLLKLSTLLIFFKGF